MTSFLNQGNGEQGNQTEQHTEEQQFSQEPQNNTEDYFLKVGDRVFKSKEDVENHIGHAQNHISKLESDFEAATSLVDRQQMLLEKARKVDDLMDAVANNQNSSGNAEETPQLSKEEVIADAVKAFEQRQTEQTQAQQAEQNWNEVTSTLTQAFGDKTNEVVQKVASENGLSVEDAASMARKHPKVFLKMFDVQATKPSAQPTRSSVNTEGFSERPAEQPRKSFMRMSAKEKASRVHQMLQELE
tara:strand:- start:44 stop:775 length:732 start_codon:yes stop_codon:yes gene_type:complete